MTEEQQEYVPPKHDPMPQVKTQVSLTRPQYERLVLLAEAKDTTMSELLRSAVEEWTLEHYVDEFAFWSSHLT
jgi:hypothetical protein